MNKPKPLYKVIFSASLTALVAITLVISATAQNFLFGVTLEIFGTSAHIALLANNAILLLLFGLPVAWVKHLDYGYLPDAETHAVKKLIFRAGVSGATANLMQFGGFKYTPRPLQASFSNLVIPLYTVLTLASNSSFVQIYSTKALYGCVLITVGCMSHMSVYFLNAPMDYTMSIIFSNTLFLLAQVPFTWSVLWQQQTLATRRLNPILFIFRVLSAHTFVNLAVLPILSVRTLTSRPWRGIINSLIEFFECCHGDASCPNSANALRVLFALALTTAATQFLQLVLVRRASYQYTASVILTIPCSVFTCQKILEFFSGIGATSPEGMMKLMGFGSDFHPLNVWIDAVPFSLCMIGAGLFRLHKANGLSRDFCVSKDVLESCPWRSSLMAGDILAGTKNTGTNLGAGDNLGTGNNTMQKRNSGTRVVHSRRVAQSSANSGTTPSVCLKVTEAECEQPRSLQLPGEARWSASGVNDSTGDENTIKKKRSRVPLPRAEREDFPPLLRPVMTNTWCIVPCEYTDYKRHVDTYTEVESASTAIEEYQPDTDEPRGHSTAPPEMQQLLTRAAFRPYLLAQYTMRHASILDSTHALMQQLRAFHTYGTIVTSTVNDPLESMRY